MVKRRSTCDAEDNGGGGRDGESDGEIYYFPKTNLNEKGERSPNSGLTCLKSASLLRLKTFDCWDGVSLLIIDSLLRRFLTHILLILNNAQKFNQLLNLAKIESQIWKR